MVQLVHQVQQGLLDLLVHRVLQEQMGLLV
jgi:hypothetical protein